MHSQGHSCMMTVRETSKTSPDMQDDNTAANIQTGRKEKIINATRVSGLGFTQILICIIC